MRWQRQLRSQGLKIYDITEQLKEKLTHVRNLREEEQSVKCVSFLSHEWHGKQWIPDENTDMGDFIL